MKLIKLLLIIMLTVIFVPNNVLAKETGQESVEIAREIELLFTKTDLIETVYPKYFGGMYIDNNNELVVQIVKDNIPTVNSLEYATYAKIMSKNTKGIIEYVQYNKSQLETVYNYILENYLGKNENLVGQYIYDQSNTLIVELQNNSNAVITSLLNDIPNSEVITFTDATSFEDTVIVNPGAGFVSSTGGTCSYGYRATTTTGQTGVVTAGHCFNGIGNYISGVGSVTKYQNNGILDAAFIPTPASNLLSQTPPFASTNILLTTIKSVYGGQNIAKIGTATGFTSGSVLSPSYSYSSDGIVFTDLIRATLNVNNGDSGGIVFENAVSFPNNGYATIGIVKAKGTGATTGQSLITKANNINSAFGIRRY